MCSRWMTVCWYPPESKRHVAETGFVQCLLDRPAGKGVIFEGSVQAQRQGCDLADEGVGTKVV